MEKQVIFAYIVLEKQTKTSAALCTAVDVQPILYCTVYRPGIYTI